MSVTDWTSGWRDRVWSQLDQSWDVIIVGGGITGAGLLRQCLHAGLRTLLVEADDFAAGTSSRSSKLVHGGLRYLKNLQVKVTLESVAERERLMRQGQGLVNRLDFLYPRMKTDRLPGWVFHAGLIVYDLMARQWAHRSYDAAEVRELCPALTTQGVLGGYRFYDAGTDDARLVLRLLRESVAVGGVALNYARVESLLKTQAGQVCGVVIDDRSGETCRQAEVRAKMVINATGVWGDVLRGQIGQHARLRPLRGSHLLIPFERLPVTQAVMFLHPRDGRPNFAIPWEGATLCGITDVDHDAELSIDPPTGQWEKEYLLSGVQQVFPGQELTESDVLSCFAGLRPVVNTGKADPSKESREHAIWDENGLLTVSGGKLTTFRIMARDALRVARKYLGHVAFDPRIPVLDRLPPRSDALFGESSLDPQQRLRLLARYGAQAVPLLCSSEPDMESVGQTAYLWAELRQAARREGVVHLCDLLLRRCRIGLLLPNGAQDEMSRIRAIAQPKLGWSDQRWQAECEAYAKLWRASYCYSN